MNGMKRICVWSKKYVPLFIGIVLLSTVLQWLYSYLPLFVQYVFNVLEQGQNDVALPKFLLTWYDNAKDTLSMILMVSASMIVLQLIRSIMRFVDNFWQGSLSQYIGFDMRCKIYNHVCDLSFSYHTNADIGDLIQRSTSDVDQISTFVAQQVPNFINIFVTVFIGAYQVYQISPILMGVSIIIVPITAISSILYYRYCNKKFDEIERAESEMTTVIQENVNAARVVRAFANESYEFDKMDQASQTYSKKNLKFNHVMAFFWGFNDCMVFLQYTATLTCGILLARQGIVNSSDIVASLLLMGMLIWPMRGLGRIIASFGKASVAAVRIGEVLDMPSEFEINGTKCPDIQGNIEFQHVSFQFEDEENALLKDISFQIHKGQTIALVGKTGSGKSTICNLITRMVEYQEGTILLDGVDLKTIDKKHLRSKIKYILQDPYLYSKTIYENIAIANQNQNKNEVYEVAKEAQIHDEIMKFELGYETMVGEKGTTLSGGQKQRVSIARALTEDAPILIFDDSLSALDTKTDSLIRESLKQKNKNQTLFIVTHRTTTSREADLILVLDEGRITQSGTHDELVEQEGLYKELWGIQGELENEFKEILRR